MKDPVRIVVGLCLFFSIQTVFAQQREAMSVDFRNFSFPATDHVDFATAPFTLRNGFFRRSRDYSSKLKSVYCGSITDIDDSVALVAVEHHDSTATYHILYVYQMARPRPKLMQSFTFGDGLNTHFGAAFTAYGELVIQKYLQKVTDAECCPSVIEISYYRWKKDQFVIQGAPREVPNGFLERTRAASLR